MIFKKKGKDAPEKEPVMVQTQPLKMEPPQSESDTIATALLSAIPDEEPFNQFTWDLEAVKAGFEPAADSTKREILAALMIDIVESDLLEGKSLEDAVKDAVEYGKNPDPSHIDLLKGVAPAIFPIFTKAPDSVDLSSVPNAVVLMMVLNRLEAAGVMIRTPAKNSLVDGHAYQIQQTYPDVIVADTNNWSATNTIDNQIHSEIVSNCNLPQQIANSETTIKAYEKDIEDGLYLQEKQGIVFSDLRRDNLNRLIKAEQARLDALNVRMKNHKQRRAELEAQRSESPQMEMWSCPLEGPFIITKL